MFENEVEQSWQRGNTSDSIFHAGKVGINTDRPDEALVIHGNLKITGHLVQPSDRRAKEGIEEVRYYHPSSLQFQIPTYSIDYGDCVSVIRLTLRSNYVTFKPCVWSTTSTRKSSPRLLG